LGKAADTDPLLGAQQRHHLAQSGVAGGEQSLALFGRQPIGSAVLAALLQECERTVVDDEELLEEALRRPKALLGPAPQARAAHLAPLAGKPVHGAAGMLRLRAL